MAGCQKEISTNNKPVELQSTANVHGIGGQYNDMLSNKVIIEWSNMAFEAAGGVAEGHPVLASRIEAMMHIAIHDALNAIVPVYEQYAYHPKQQCDLANPFAAAASAAHTVLKASWPDSASMLDAKLSESLSNIPDGPGKTKGIALGIASGNAILALRAGDGALSKSGIRLACFQCPWSLH